MTDNPGDRSLLARVREGSEGAATLLYRRYADRLRELARAQCSPALARLVEPDDIVQSVFGSFFRAAGRGLYDLPDGEELWKLFLVISLNKIRARARHHGAARRDAARTVAGAAGEISLEEVATGDFAAETVLQMTIDDALAVMPEAQRRAVLLRAEGREVEEIARAISRSMRSTERLLQDARKILADALAAGEDVT